MNFDDKITRMHLKHGRTNMEFGFFFIALIATTLGAITGMGGGVMLRPALDLFSNLDALSVSMMSSISVFSMTIISIGKQVQQKSIPPLTLSAALALGSLIGGNIGQFLLSNIVRNTENHLVIITQNAILAFFILIVLIYMQSKSKIPSRNLQGILPGILTGFALGTLASFLGIGGGPINVAIIIYLFGLNTKAATLCSLVTIFFSQAANLFSAFVFHSHSSYDFSLVLPLIIGAIMGGFLGAICNKKMRTETVERTFKIISLIVLGVCVLNMINA